MNHLKRFRRVVESIGFFAVFLPAALSLITYELLQIFFAFNAVINILIVTVLLIVTAVIASRILADISLNPITKIWQAVWHVSPDKSDQPAPSLEDFRFGQGLVSALVTQIYDLASQHTPAAETASTTAAPRGPDILEQIPLPLLILDKNLVIRASNTTAHHYAGLEAQNINGKNIHDVLRMSFTNEDTFDAWYKQASDSRATDTRTWEHAKAQFDGGKIERHFSLAVNYSKDEPNGNEVVLVLFDRTDFYTKEERASSYVAMAVHELRTPLTVLRGYIEVFEDELGPKLNPELQQFMLKMSAAAQSLSAFVSNILNVARIDENQLTMSLHEADWGQTLTTIIRDLELRAGVRGKKLELDIEPELPPVAIDQISMYEVVSNLVDNAIKYSGQSERIIVHARKLDDKTVETVVEDFGPGMSESILPQLFTKFYRSHRSRTNVTGSGLGLYLVKSIVTAHGGNVFVNSKENEGSRFGFTLQTFATMKGSNPDAASDGIERQASGWIKNHSMYRR